MYLVDVLIFKMLPVCVADQWTPNFFRRPQFKQKFNSVSIRDPDHRRTLFFCFKAKLKVLLGDQVF